MFTDLALNMEQQLGAHLSLWGTLSHTNTPNIRSIGPKLTKEVPTMSTDLALNME
jgi:hypothetical protein